MARACVSTEHLDSAPSFTKWTKLTSIPWTLKSYYNAPLLKTIRSGPAGFLIILSSAERIILMLQTNWLLVPSVLATRFLWPQTVIQSQAVRIQVVEQDVVNQTGNLGQETLTESSWQCPPCDEDWDKDLWEQTSTSFVWGTAQPTTVATNSPASKLWLPASVFPSLRHVSCHGKIM